MICKQIFFTYQKRESQAQNQCESLNLDALKHLPNKICQLHSSLKNLSAVFCKQNNFKTLSSITVQ